RFWPDLLRHRGGKCDNVVLNLSLDLPYAFHVKATALTDGAGCFRRHQAGFGQSVAGGDLHLQPLPEAVFVAPDPSHLRPGVSRDHRITSGAGLSGMCMGTAYCTWPLTAATNPEAAQVRCARHVEPARCHATHKPLSPLPNIARSPSCAITFATSCASVRKPR